MSKIERPLDFLDAKKNESILVKCKDDKSFAGTLLAFDIHINLVLEMEDKTIFLRGDDVRSVETIQ